MANTEEMIEYALKLLELGYVPLRVDPDSKAARNPGWQAETPTEDSLRRSFARTSNIGIRCGDPHKDGSVLAGIDIDIEEAELIRCVERAIGDASVPVKRGKKGATYMVRLDRATKSGKIHWLRDGKKINAIDVLCGGAQTVIPPSIHPETKLPYKWIAGTPLDQVDYRSLPIFGTSLLDEIRGFCKDPEDAIYALNDMEWAGVGGGGNTHDVCLRAVSSMVARQWTDADIHLRVERAKREACEAAGAAFMWPEAYKTIQEWIDSSRNKKFDVTTTGVRLKDVPMVLINRYAYVQSLNQMWDLEKSLPVEKDVFNNLHCSEVKQPWKTLTEHPDLRKVDRLTYAPGEPVFCKEKSYDSDVMMDCLNTYCPSGVEPEEGDVAPFVDLLSEVLDHHPDAIKHVTSFFAHMVQNPQERINHALVLQGEQGIGKDSLIAALEKLVGRHNSIQVTLQHVESQFNEWLFGKQLVVYQEMLAPGRRGIYNRLKTYITDPFHTVNVKMTKLQRIPNRAAYIFLTNYKHALSIDPTDRRLWVWFSKMQPRSPSYFKNYYMWLNDPRSPGHLLDYLLKYDISDFKPAAPPPMTDAKRQMLETSAGEVEQYLRGAIESQTWPMGCDLVSVQHLHGALRSTLRASTGIITEALDNLCPEGFLDQRPRIGGSRMRLRCIRNFTKWSTAPSAELAKAYRMPLPPQQGENEGAYQVYSGSGLTEDDGSAQY